MLTEYKLKKHHNDQLCSIFHRGITNAELTTGKAELAFGDYVIRQLRSLSNSYGVWFKGNFILVLNDLPLHKFSVSVHENNFMTENMTKIVIDCVIVAFKQQYVAPAFKTQKELTEVLNDMIVTHSDILTQDEVETMSELLYGDGC